MSNIPYNSLKAVCTASQMRSKLEQKLRKMLGEERLIGPLDPYVFRAYQAGKIDEATRDQLIDISLYCETVLLSSKEKEIPPFETLLEWSKTIDEL
jgi:hypothetical protein